MLLEVKNLKKYFPIKSGLFSRTTDQLKAVDDISISLKENEVLGVVGESGCGKSTLGKTILHLHEPTSGTVIFQDKQINYRDESQRVNLRKNMQIIFQDPANSLDPRQTIRDILDEPLKIHAFGDRNRREKRILELLNMVQMPSNIRNRYPHEFSGGQCQRIGIARALALEPKLIIADEPVSALDVSVQAQIINLMKELKKELGLSYIFISHDLGVVRHISDRIAVMYLGKIVETGSSEDIINSPMHPYTKALISAVPSITLRKNKKPQILKGDIPSPINPPSGCHFHTRCPEARKECSADIPELRSIENDRLVSCPFS